MVHGRLLATRRPAGLGKRGRREPSGPSSAGPQLSPPVGLLSVGAAQAGSQQSFSREQTNFCTPSRKNVNGGGVRSLWRDELGSRAWPSPTAPRLQGGSELPNLASSGIHPNLLFQNPLEFLCCLRVPGSRVETRRLLEREVPQGSCPETTNL